MSMDMELMKFGFQVLQFVLTGGICIYVYLSNKDKVTNSRIGKLEHDLDDKLDGQGERIARLETRVENSPTHDDLGGIHEKINQLRAEVGHLSGEFVGVRNLLNTIHQHLLTGGKK